MAVNQSVAVSLRLARPPGSVLSPDLTLRFVCEFYVRILGRRPKTCVNREGQKLPQQFKVNTKLGKKLANVSQRRDADIVYTW